MNNSNKINKNSDQGKSSTLRIATYNIAAGRVSSLEKLAEAIKALNPDIIALQEVDKNTNRSGNVDQIEELVSLTGMPYGLFGKAIELDGGEYGVGMLSKYPIAYDELLQLPSGNEEQRVLLAAEITQPNIDENVVFLCTHLDWHEDNAIRKQQIQTINAYAITSIASQIPNIETKLQILAGDFNEVTHSSLFKEAERYFTNLIPTDIDTRTWPAIRPGLDIDHILAYNNYNWPNVEVIAPKNQEFGISWKEVSDHLPLAVVLSYETT